ncbi:hypothetical protein Kpol_1018p170 [Vanderwaltozyma polyspora DSM 70294]|uniref:Letm1 RBD domain-containing protein n=1 Tax=Vanderwaltozyma polyspora (strain ATCC 22028 / DSM 70294 / BCRC 21397 / CBS 2163 / NBRC 10782 / NRRL Y-8283 / UCD 57-17) TaxID=436907 RepID=A7TE10_VANPO|nr:uncharacterized protein Kpol_1018p170 [Vanderwaltozyma polyspora DSM 70294]EDO19630.1 hypothetical protein Kpol_1018p170 [Vanderwaltozyma polyspora DSM 70294]
MFNRSLSLIAKGQQPQQQHALLSRTLIGTFRGSKQVGLPSIVSLRYYSAAKNGEPEKVKEPLMERIKHEVKHYVNGTKLLGYEIKISTKLLIKFGQGYELTRRETNQLKRTISDVFRLIPFSAFIIIPFAELLLPIALKIFPNLLPSTYESGKDKQLKRDKLLDTRRKTSNFLHETLEESNLLNYNSIENTEKKQAFLNFFRKLYDEANKDKSDIFSHQEILKIANMFKNDTILDNLSRPQLVAICKFMSLRPFGNDNLIRYQIRHKLKSIMQDDITIDYEGVQSLSPEELHQACVSRGIKAFGTSQEDLQNFLKVWLELRLRQKVPSVLMVLCSTYTFGGTTSDIANKVISAVDPSSPKTRYNEILDLYYEGIFQVLSSIPDPVYNVAKLDVTESKPTEDDLKQAEEIKATPTEAATESTTKVESPVETPAESPKTTEPTTIKETIEKEQPKVETEQTDEKPVEIETTSKPDDSEFKLSVLKEQEEMIKKEEMEAKARKTRDQVVTDDINLDEEEATALPKSDKMTPEEIKSK